MTGDILVCGEIRNGKLKKVASELVGGARTIAAGTGGAIDALLIGKGAEGEASKLARHGLRRIAAVDDGLTADYSSEGYAKVL
ncbi:MAG: electron transfer flavoprotein subunit alpha, partial [Candidatus Krumholzibacteria bacterium]|nr:electron transfer flavoprotein subunit alpha [Candidatus Krumholzibacteria bacterium]